MSRMTLNFEDYLLVMWEYQESFGKVSETDISKRLKIRPPTVNEYVHKLQQMGLVQIKTREVSFTNSGKRFTIPIVRAHRIAEVFAQKVLEVPWEEVHKAVMDLEHLFSGNYGENLYKHLGYPSTCPHGNPISVAEKDSSASVMISPEGTYKIKRIIFEDYSLLTKLANASILPDTTVKIYKDGRTELEGPGGNIYLDDSETQMVHLKKTS